MPPEREWPTGTLTAKGRSVSVAHFSMLTRNWAAASRRSPVVPGTLTVPRPPALETAAASPAVSNGPIPSWTTGCSIPRSRVYAFWM